MGQRGAEEEILKREIVDPSHDEIQRGEGKEDEGN